MSDVNKVFPSIGHRVWFAWHCLPRDAKDQPPSFRSLEERYGLSNATLRRWLWDLNTERPTRKGADGVARALGTTPEWIVDEDGPGPKADRPIKQRPTLEEAGIKAKRAPSGSMKRVGTG